MDVTALYPSLDQKESARMAKEAYLESELEVEEIDWKAASLYLALTVSRQDLVREGIAHLIARRKQGRGRKPTVCCSRMSGPMTKEERRELEKASVDEVEWENEDELVIGERGDPEPKDFEPDERWVYPREPITKEERKKIVGRIIEEAMKVTFNSHVYTYGNKLYIQRKGGAIGLRLTRVVGQVGQVAQEV